LSHLLPESTLAESDPVTQELPSNWARFGIVQDDYYLLFAQPGTVTFTVTPNENGHRTEVILWDSIHDQVLMDRVFAGKTADTFSVTNPAFTPLRLILFDDRLQALTVTGPGLSVRPGTPAIVLPVTPYVTWNSSQSVQAELRNPDETGSLKLYLDDKEIASSLLQPDGSVAPATVDTSNLADGLYDLRLVGADKGPTNFASIVRPILVDRTPAFADVPPEHWAHQPVEVMFALEIVNGKAPGRFAPDDAVLRAEFAKMLAVTLGLEADLSQPSPFADVPNEYWARPYIQALYQAGIAHGEAVDGHLYFRPTRTITRAEASTIIARVLGVDQETDYTPTFSDWDSVPGWAQPSVANLAKFGWVNGFPDGSYKPQAELSRAQSAKVLVKFLGL
jgi:hypothetical protein